MPVLNLAAVHRQQEGSLTTFDQNRSSTVLRDTGSHLQSSARLRTANKSARLGEQSARQVLVRQSTSGAKVSGVAAYIDGDASGFSANEASVRSVMPAMFRWCHRPRGQSLVEFAIVFPVFIALVGGVIQFGMVFWAQNTLTQVVRDTGRWAATQNTHAMREWRHCPLAAGRLDRRKRFPMGSHVNRVRERVRPRGLHDRQLHGGW